MMNIRLAIRAVVAAGTLLVFTTVSPYGLRSLRAESAEGRNPFSVSLHTATGEARGQGASGVRPNVLSSSIELNPSGRAPLAAVATVITDIPTRVRLFVSDGDRQWTIRSGDDFETLHRIPVLGLRPATLHSVDVGVVGHRGQHGAAPPLTVQTDPLPSDFPPVSVVSNPSQMAPGFTFFAVGKWPLGRDPNYGLVIAVDSAGEIVWYYKTDLHAADDVSRLSNGHLMINDIGNLAGRAIEIDMLGNIVQSWHPRLRPSSLPNSTFVDTDTLHHDMVELPNGHFLTLSSELRVISGFPTLDPTDPTETANVIGDVVVELRRDGSIVNEWKMFDMVDPHRAGYQSPLGFWNAAYGNPAGGTRAWTWGNAVFYVEMDDSILVSLRHQNAVVKFSRATGAIKWIFGDHTGWGPDFQQYLLNPTAGTTWTYGQHGAKITRRGTLLLHDNGNFRAMPPNPPTPATQNYSRGVEYRIDEDGMRVHQVWDFGGNQYYAPFLGDADLLQRNNVLITFGGQVKVDGVPTDGFGQRSAQILEIDRRGPRDEIVLEISVQDPTTSYTVFRSQRMRSLYD